MQSSAGIPLESWREDSWHGARVEVRGGCACGEGASCSALPCLPGSLAEAALLLACCLPIVLFLDFVLDTSSIQIDLIRGLLQTLWRMPAMKSC